MPPYLQAFEAYHAHGTPTIFWPTALDFHFQRGLVLSGPDFFLMARYLKPGLSDAHHLNLIDDPPSATTRDVHIWSFAGSLEALAVALIRRPELYKGLETVTFQRRGAGLRRKSFDHLSEALFRRVSSTRPPV